MDHNKYLKLKAAVILAIAEHMIVNELDLEGSDGETLIPQKWVNEAREMKDEFYRGAQRESESEKILKR